MKGHVCEPLGNQHDRTQFDCGVSVLNDYLAKYAKQDVKRKAAAVFVVLKREEPKRVIGFYTLCATSVALSDLPEEVTRRLPRYPEIPAILAGRLARDVDYPGVGSLLLSDAITRCVRVAIEIAASLIVVDSKGEAATHFYEKFGFISLPKLPDRMFLPMQTAEKL
ncbi:MAG: GNAT family N-acetyltransferase [Planctomyces sp.]|nr:GNAT family N-acetyltransferase [Planctomyces sp.]